MLKFFPCLLITFLHLTSSKDATCWIQFSSDELEAAMIIIIIPSTFLKHRLSSAIAFTTVCFVVVSWGFHQRI